MLNSVHCRTGSLEMVIMAEALASGVHCRTGSLEKANQRAIMYADRPLPHRQLRKRGKFACCCI